MDGPSKDSDTPGRNQVDKEELFGSAPIYNSTGKVIGHIFMATLNPATGALDFEFRMDDAEAMQEMEQKYGKDFFIHNTSRN